MMNYSITTKYRSGEDDDDKEWNKINDCGGFRSTVDFTVTDQDKKTDEVNGIIVQYIQKSTTVDIYKTKGGGIKDILNTTEEISEYTNNNVKYMNDNYLEYFKIENGKGVDGDQFGNGPICKYTKKKIPIVDDELDMSEGTIIQNGYAIYIPYPQAQKVKDEYEWNDNKKLPANGLPMIPFDEEIWTELFNMKQSIVYAHKVSYKWTYLNIIKQARKVIYLDSCEEDESAFESAPDPNEEAEEEDDDDDYDDLAAAMAMSLGLSAKPVTQVDASEADEESEITSAYPISKTKSTRESAKPVEPLEPLESKEPQEKQKGGRRKTRRKKTKKETQKIASSS